MKRHHLPKLHPTADRAPSGLAALAIGALLGLSGCRVSSPEFAGPSPSGPTAQEIHSLERRALLLDPRLGQTPFTHSKIQPITLQPIFLPQLDTLAPLVPAIHSVTTPGCQLVTLQWHPVADRPTMHHTLAKKYRLFRNGILVAETTDTRVTDWKFLSARTTYQYQLSAVDALNNVSPLSAPVSATTPACDVSSNQGALQTVVLLMKFPDLSPDLSVEPFAPSVAQDLIFGPQDSLDTLLRANSYGQSHLAGSTSSHWLTLPRSANHYCSQVGPLPDGSTSEHWAWNCNFHALVADAIRVADPIVDYSQTRHVIFVWNRAAMATSVGYRGFAQAIQTQEGPLQPSVIAMSSSHFNPSNPRRPQLGALLHELGHALGTDFKQGWEGGAHAGGLFCARFALPIPEFLTDLPRSGCGFNEYGDREDPLGRSVVRHFSTYRKEVMGLVSSHRSGLIRQDGIYYIDALEAQSQATQEIRIPMDHLGHLYTLNFRADVAPFERTPGTSGAAPGIDVRLRLPYQQSGSLFAVTTLAPGTEMTDPYRNLQIEHMSMSDSGTTAKVRIRGAGALQKTRETPLAALAPTIVQRTTGNELHWNLNQRVSTRRPIEYRIYRNGAWIGSTGETKWTDVSASPAVPQCYTVSVYDATPRIVSPASPETCVSR